MKKRQEMRKRCQALVLAGILGAGTLGSAYTAYAAGPGETPASVGASAAGGPGDVGRGQCGGEIERNARVQKDTGVFHSQAPF